jgi:hypothetical protein
MATHGAIRLGRSLALPESRKAVYRFPGFVRPPRAARTFSLKCLPASTSTLSAMITCVPRLTTTTCLPAFVSIVKGWPTDGVTVIL